MSIGRCTVVNVGPVASGGVPVIMKASDGTLFGVDILRHDLLCPGVSRGGRLAVYMNNGGKGSTATIESHGLGAMALAQWLARREALGHSVPALLTLRQRAPLLAAARR